MKTTIFFSLGLLLLATAVFTIACDSPEDTPEAITVTDTGTLTQEVDANQTAGTSDVTIITAGAWTSSIAAVEAQKSLSAQLQGAMRPTDVAPTDTVLALTDTVSTSAWISISPDQGDKAGTYTIRITLVPNTTDADRTAVITILCQDTEITITVTQKAKEKDAYGGAGTFTNTLAADQPLTVDEAKYKNRSILFYKDSEELSGALYFNIGFPGQAADVPLPAGTYTFYDYGTPSAINVPEYHFYCQKGILGGVIYYGKGGTLTVSIDGDIYTVTLDMDTYHEYSENPTSGKIRGSYTGYLPVE
ncbi:MAG: BACON domain-containing protein [Bacteroidales bacterium]|jgi:hypothetical protein|nr:BACON domain-containing protein [Bacteroidales bacterium]